MPDPPLPESPDFRPLRPSAPSNHVPEKPSRPRPCGREKRKVLLLVRGEATFVAPDSEKGTGMSRVSSSQDPRRGFTLIELMLVVTIIAIISAMAIPGLLKARMAGNEASAISTM